MSRSGKLYLLILVVLWAAALATAPLSTVFATEPRPVVDSNLRASVTEVEGARFVCFTYREGLGGSAVDCHRLDFPGMGAGEDGSRSPVVPAPGSELGP